eukprot:NODE_169_length_14535_cov_0.769881.p4 type:complete len:573 gc:universal NODE_169_length_14535_cov_0.769881:14350-12632(-)
MGKRQKKLERPFYPTVDPEYYKTLNKRNNKNQSVVTNTKINVSYKHSTDFITKIKLYFMHEGSKVVFLLIYYGITVYIALYKYATYSADPKYALTRVVLKKALPFARIGAGLLMFNSALILFPVCRTLISTLRRTILNTVIPFDKNIVFHKFVGFHIVIFTALHIGAHTLDFLYLSEFGKLPLGFVDMGSPEYLWVTLIPAITGHAAVLCLFLMVTSAMQKMRHANFEIFWFTHHLFILFIGAMVVHGSGCIIETLVNAECYAYTEYWKWVVLSMFCYLCERLVFRALIRARRPVKIRKVIIHPSNVVELQWAPRYENQMKTARPGQYIFLNCPVVGGKQFHPFTLTSCPEEGHMSIHFREAGDFTKRLSKLFVDSVGNGDSSSPNFLPNIYVDGPFGAAAEDAFDYETIVLIGAGIGVTPFASLLKSIFFKAEMEKCPVRNVKFFWICRDTTAFEWFNDLLHTLEEQDSVVNLEYHIYLTKVRPSMVTKVILNDVGVNYDPITGLQSKTNYGRPNWDNIFANIALQHPKDNVGVFVCGPKPLTSVLKKNCLLYTHYQNTSTIFHFNKENFG